MDSKTSFLLESLNIYYNNPVNMKTFVEVLQDKSIISLRMIDWFITKYSKSNQIQYPIDNLNFVVFDQYKYQLKAYSKKKMDPFCRRERILLSKHGYEIITTVGQMNFFRWAIENKVLSYLVDNIKTIIKEMKFESKDVNTRKHKKNNEKRSFTKTTCMTVVDFN